VTPSRFGSEPFNRAIRWISAHRQDYGATLAGLVRAASFKFNLSPLEEQGLWNLLTRPPGQSAD
jgi:hypothetical protein